MKTSDQFGQVAAALAAAQGQFGPIARDKTVRVATRSGSSYTFAYAPLETIMAAIRPALAANGLALTQGPIVTESGIEALRTMLVHKSGEWIANDTAVLVDKADGGKSAQAYGSGLTYARRYGITTLLCLVADEDDDGNAASGNSVEVVRRPASNHLADAMARIAAAADETALGEVGAMLSKLDVDENSKNKLRTAFSARRKELAKELEPA
jgi:hypothetical protein